MYNSFKVREEPDREMDDERYPEEAYPVEVEGYPEEEYDDSDDVIGELRLPVFRGVNSDEDEDDTEEEY